MSDFKLKTAAGQVVEFPAALLASISNDLFELKKEARHAYISGFADQLISMNRFQPWERSNIQRFMKRLAKSAKATGYDVSIPERRSGTTYFNEILDAVRHLPELVPVDPIDPFGDLPKVVAEMVAFQKAEVHARRWVTMENALRYVVKRRETIGR